MQLMVNVLNLLSFLVGPTGDEFMEPRGQCPPQKNWEPLNYSQEL